MLHLLYLLYSTIQYGQIYRFEVFQNLWRPVWRFFYLEEFFSCFDAVLDESQALHIQLVLLLLDEKYGAVGGLIWFQTSCHRVRKQLGATMDQISGLIQYVHIAALFQENHLNGPAVLSLYLIIVCDDNALFHLFLPMASCSVRAFCILTLLILAIIVPTLLKNLIVLDRLRSLKIYQFSQTPFDHFFLFRETCSISHENSAILFTIVH